MGGRFTVIVGAWSDDGGVNNLSLIPDHGNDAYLWKSPSVFQNENVADTMCGLHVRRLPTTCELKRWHKMLRSCGLPQCNSQPPPLKSSLATVPDGADHLPLSKGTELISP